MDSALDRVEVLLEEGRQYTFENFCYMNDRYGEYAGADTPEWTTWVTRVRNLINETVDEAAPAVRLVTQATRISTSGNRAGTFERKRDQLLLALNQTKEALEQDAYNERKRESASPPSPDASNRVFIVHGHDDTLKTDLEIFVTARGLEPVVLHRQPDGGRTLIEKFEEYSDVGYAFVLLTPDDLALTKIKDPRELHGGSLDQGDYEYRARQNVIFEFGFFVGRLGRDRVCCIYRSDVVLPSDIRGLVYKEIKEDVESIGMKLIQELQHAGYTPKL